ncbi:hypothetical protein GPU89_02830 [Burkholderia cepacia]|nr:hypothetical protein [Burkholderia cepacia]
MQAIAFANHRSIADSYDHAISAWYTHHLTRATVFDGMTFPPGSTVVLEVNSPHSVKSGTVPSNTPLLGLNVSGDFYVLRSDDSTSYIYYGTLAKLASIGGIECAPGQFTHHKERTFFDHENIWTTWSARLPPGFETANSISLLEPASRRTLSTAPSQSRFRESYPTRGKFSALNVVQGHLNTTRSNSSPASRP